MSHSPKRRPAAISALFDNSLFLIGGAIAALIWANTHKTSYEHFVHFDLTGGVHADAEHGTADEASHTTTEPAHAVAATDESAAEGSETQAEMSADHHGGLSVHFLVNDILMALFFAIAAKEVWEALLPGGALSNPKKAATPLLATLGGILGPAGVYMCGVFASGQHELTNGWAVPCATDIAFSYLVARIIFGPGHPAIAFLLLLAIADDAAGLMILAVFYPSKALAPGWLMLALAAIAGGMFMKKKKVHNFWWYLLIPGAASWFAFYKAGIHPALGLVPIIPTLPHAGTDLGFYSDAEEKRQDTLNAFEHWWKDPVEIVLGLFGLVNAGVAFSSSGTGTWLVLGGLIIGKPVGILLFTWIAQKGLKLEIPGGMNYRDVLTLGMIAAIGFTVALFVSTAAFPVPPATQATLDSVKMGALGSFGAAFLAIALGKVLRIRKYKPEVAAESSPTHSVAVSRVDEPIVGEVIDEEIAVAVATA